MAKVFLLSVVEGTVPRELDALAPLHNLRRCAAVDRFAEHTLVQDPDAADLIVFVELRGAGLWQRKLWFHPLVRRHPRRCFAISSADQIVPFLPGIYASLPRDRYHPRRHRTGHYLRGLFRPELVAIAPPGPPDLLATFRGSLDTHAVRRALTAIASPRIAIEDSQSLRRWLAHGPRFMGYGGDAVADYVRLARRGAFVLCPRGFGTSSMRLFEAMQLARAPVIISDAWVPPEGPAWETFSVRVAENDVGRLPEILAAREPEAAAMGTRARAAWEEWFSEEVTFHRFVAICLALAEVRRVSEPLDRWISCARGFDRDFVAAYRRFYGPHVEATLKRALRSAWPSIR
jgi:hypothetical protein